MGTLLLQQSILIYDVINVSAVAAISFIVADVFMICFMSKTPWIMEHLQEKVLCWHFAL